MESQTVKDNRTIADLFSELTHETRLLLQQEIHLAKAEIGEKIQQAERGATSLVIGALLCYAGLLALLGAAVFGLALVVQPWLAALIVGVITAIVGIGFVARGRENLKARNLTLPRTATTLQEDKQWIKAHTMR